MTNFMGHVSERMSLTSWSCRLVGILGKAVERGLVSRLHIDGMLHSMLWTGLKPSLKDISGYKYDTIKYFDGLRVALRQIESDHCNRTATKPAKPQTSKSANDRQTDAPSEMDELKGMINQIRARRDGYDKRFQQEQSQEREPSTSWPQNMQ